MEFNLQTPQGGSIVIDRISKVSDALGEETVATYDQRVSYARRCQLATSDHLLRKQFGETHSITRDLKGIPSVTGSDLRVSISHTGDYLALMSHPACRVAIDIERLERNLSMIEKRFTTPEEVSLAATVWGPVAAHFLWSCKECLFKVMRLEAVHFKENLRLKSIEQQTGGSLWEVSHPELSARFRLNSLIFESLIISYIDQPPLIA